MDILLLLIFSISNIVCFVIGAKVGQKVVKGESIELPKPVEAIREHKSREEAKKKQDRLDVIMHNINAYDGTSNGQKEVPKR